MMESNAKLATTNTDIRREMIKLRIAESRLREAVCVFDIENGYLRSRNTELKERIDIQNSIIWIGVIQRQRLLGLTDASLVDEHRLAGGETDLDDEDEVAVIDGETLAELPEFSVV
jgi:hypothetical protein